MTVFAIAVAMLSPTNPALAQNRVPAISCEAADFNLMMRLYMPLIPDGSGVPGPAGMQGTVEITHQKVPKDRRLWSLEGKRPVMFWNRDNELRMLLQLGGGDAAIRIVIETKRQPTDYEYRGSFGIDASEVKLKGRLACVIG
ncbi:MAG: hypothetical protein R3D67_01505 [Hyphomicrobiaceae bacterium]